MSWVDDAIAEFGRSLGLPGLQLGDQAVLNLVFEKSGTLFIERQEAELVLYVARQVAAHDDRRAEAALALCHPRQRWPLPVRAGLRGDDTLVLITRIPEREVSVPALQSAVELLFRLHDKAAA
jgi:type III secretion system chaperone SycN